MVPFVKIVAGAEDIAKLWADGWQSPKYTVFPGFDIQMSLGPWEPAGETGDYSFAVSVVRGWSCEIFGKAIIDGLPHEYHFGSRASPLSYPANGS